MHTQDGATIWVPHRMGVCNWQSASLFYSALKRLMNPLILFSFEQIGKISNDKVHELTMCQNEVKWCREITLLGLKTNKHFGNRISALFSGVGTASLQESAITQHNIFFHIMFMIFYCPNIQLWFFMLHNSSYLSLKYLHEKHQLNSSKIYPYSFSTHSHTSL